jgi:hypothetical protein
VTLTLLIDPVDFDDSQPHESSFVDIVERLFQQFEQSVPLTTIVGVVRDARHQLSGSPLHAIPELTERLAIERLRTLVHPDGIPSVEPA